MPVAINHSGALGGCGPTAVPSPARGGGSGWGPISPLQSRSDRLQDTSPIMPNVVVPKSQDAPAPQSEELIPRQIAAVGMLTPVGFDNELCLDAHEIRDVGRDRMLATEAMPKPS